MEDPVHQVLHQPSNGNNTITLNSLNDGTYSDCTIRVTNASGYVSDSITITSFVVDSTAATLAEVIAVTTLTNDSTPELHILF